MLNLFYVDHLVYYNLFAVLIITNTICFFHIHQLNIKN